jgi:hypothetical protein
MGYPTKVQLIQRQASEQWYVNFPSAIAQAMEFQKGERVEWLVEDKETLVLRRLEPAPRCLKKNMPRRSSASCSGSGKNAGAPSSSNGPGNERGA